MSYSSRVSIPNSAKKTIQNIKEIAGNHSDDEVYAMLKECSMDPNETAQKLLFQDTFHEVKRKRDKKREALRKVLIVAYSQSNRELMILSGDQDHKVGAQG
ncbi:hypothetical protein HPP92_018977 [Vanilla planifolia]|uniref:GBF-interacting protein 1 N-terminal domain-containing protein n=1 Tax=Vanilla planifolia TaxID=51239 RepID=A0A835QGN7_VANPL|nr:hypothetical protein HPP92_018977 [Vanilla planifolia]